MEKFWYFIAVFYTKQGIAFREGYVEGKDFFPIIKAKQNSINENKYLEKAAHADSPKEFLLEDVLIKDVIELSKDDFLVAISR